jgi:hypothetical protein
MIDCSDCDGMGEVTCGCCDGSGLEACDNCCGTGEVDDEEEEDGM